MIDIQAIKKSRQDILAVADAADVPDWARDELMRIHHSLLFACDASAAYGPIGYEAGSVPRMPRERK